MKKVQEMTVEELKLEERELKNRLKEVVSESVVRSIKNEIQKMIDFNPDVPELKSLTKVNWEFTPESDDEGGLDYWPSYVTAYDSNDDEIPSDINIKQKYDWSDDIYEYELNEVLHEIINDHHNELYEYDIEEIIL